MSIIQLRDTEPFSNLPDEKFKDLLASVTQKVFPAQTFIFNKQTHPTGHLYMISEGMVEILATVPGGDQLVVDYRKEGSFFGITPIFNDEPYTGGARTVTETTCYLIPQHALTKVTKDYPAVSEYFTRMVLSRVRCLYADIVKQHTSNAVTQMEAYPFKKRLSEIMTTPVATCSAEVTGQAVARQMTEKSISSILVVNEKSIPLGIITERDLIAKVLSPDAVNCSEITAAEIMTRHPLSLSPNTYMYEAMAYLMANRLKHLPVVEQGQLVGMVTLRDLMRYRSQKAMLLVGSINEQRRLEGLATAKREIHNVARSLLTGPHSTPEVVEIISYIHHKIIKRCHDICYQQMLDEGYHPPSIRYCFLVMGSGGRREMLLNPDQDNGFIFEDVSDDKIAEINKFFVPFAKKLVAALAQVGYPLCEGQVMVTNPAWCGRLGDWQRRIHDWVSDPEPQKVRYSSIFFDFVAIEGDTSLAQSLRDIVYEEIRNFEGFLYHMMSLDLRNKVPVGLFGRFMVVQTGEHKGSLSLKLGGTMYIVACLRMFALKERLLKTTTIDRLNALVLAEIFERDTAEHIKAAFEALTFLRLRNEIHQVDSSQEPSHYLNPDRLSKSEQELLTESFRAVNTLRDATKRHFTGPFF